MRRVLIIIGVAVLIAVLGISFFSPSVRGYLTSLELSVASIISPPPVVVDGYAVALAEASQAPIPGVLTAHAAIESVEVEDADGAWHPISGPESPVPLLGNATTAIATILGQGPLPAGDYQAVRYTLGTTTLTTKGGTLTAITPATTFTIPIVLVIDSGDVSSIKLTLITTQSLIQSAPQSFTFTPHADIETHTQAEILVSSDDQHYIYLNDGTLTQVVSATMSSTGDVSSKEVAISIANAFVRPVSVAPVATIKKVSSTVVKKQIISHPTLSQPPASPTPPSTPALSAPTFSYLGSQDIAINTPFSFTVHATSPSQTPLSYTAQILPAGSTFDPNTQTISWTPTTLGTYTVLVTASDGTHTVDQTIPIIVVPQPTQEITTQPQTQQQTQTQQTTQQPSTPSTGAGLVVNYGPEGIATMYYNGQLVTNDYYNYFWVETTLKRSDGSTYQYGQPPATTTWDGTQDIRTDTFPWGTLASKYTASSNRLTIQYTVTNTTGDTMQGFNVHDPYIYPVDGGPGGPAAAFGIDQPDAVAANFNFGTMALVDDAPSQDVYLDISSTNISNEHIVRFGTEGESWASPDSWPTFSNLPISAGTSQTYTISLRFGPSGSTAAALAPDAYQSFAQRFPATLNWPDRRPIGNLFPSGHNLSGDWSTNPRGWFNDPTLTVLTPDGLASFRARLLAYATTSLAILQQYDAQGVIVWDIEGEGYPFTYVGDPTAATKLAPELAYDNTIGDFFKVFTAAGLRVGVTLRDQDVVFDSSGNPSVVVPSNEAQDYENKIAYAQSQWGASLFYIDSTNPNTVGPVMAAVHAAYPNVLLIPEIESFSSYASSAAYNEVRGGTLSTPADVRAAYPNAFSVLYIEDVDITPDISALTTGVQNGDILLFHGWFPEAVQGQMAQIYAAAGKPLSIANSTPDRFGLVAAASESQSSDTLAAGVILGILTLLIVII